MSLRNGLFMGDPEPVGKGKVDKDGVFAFADGVEAGRAYVLRGQDHDERDLTVTSFGKDGPEIAKPKRSTRRKPAAKK